MTPNVFSPISWGGTGLDKTPWWDPSQHVEACPDTPHEPRTPPAPSGPPALWFGEYTVNLSITRSGQDVWKRVPPTWDCPTLKSKLSLWEHSKHGCVENQTLLYWASLKRLSALWSHPMQFHNRKHNRALLYRKIWIIWNLMHSYIYYICIGVYFLLNLLALWFSWWNLD